MFELINSNGKPVLMQSGSPFRYSTRELADMGRKALASKIVGPLTIAAV